MPRIPYLKSCAFHYITLLKIDFCFIKLINYLYFDLLNKCPNDTCWHNLFLIIQLKPNIESCCESDSKLEF